MLPVTEDSHSGRNGSPSDSGHQPNGTLCGFSGKKSTGLSEEAEAFLVRLDGTFTSSSFRERLHHARVAGGSYIRALREEAAVSQKDLASRLKISAAFLSHIESGRINLPPEQVEALAIGLRCLDRREFAARILYAYHHPLFVALGNLDIASIWDVTRVRMASFNIMPSGQDLSLAEERRGRRHSVMGTRLRLRRLELGLSQENMSAYIGYSKRTAVSNIEHGVARITYPYMVKWCRILEVPSEQMASFILYFCERMLFHLAEESGECIYNGLETMKLQEIMLKSGSGITSPKYLVGTPYMAGGEARVDVICETLGSREILCIHRNLDTHIGCRYWLTDVNGKILLGEVGCLDDLVSAI